MDDDTSVTNTIDDMITMLDIVEQFSDWSGIRLHVGKYKITTYIQGLQPIRKKTDRDDALRARLSHVSPEGHRIGVLSQDESLRGGYLSTSLVVSKRPPTVDKTPTEAHLQGCKPSSPTVTHQATSLTLWSTLQNKPNPLPHGALADNNGEVDSILKGTSRKKLESPQHLPAGGFTRPNR